MQRFGASFEIYKGMNHQRFEEHYQFCNMYNENQTRTVCQCALSMMSRFLVHILLHPMSIQLAKDQLRKQIKAKILTVSDEILKDRSIRIAQEITSSPIYKNATSIGVYAHMAQQEVKTTELIRQCFKDSKKVFLPKCIQKDGNRTLKFIRLESFEQVCGLTPQGRLMIREPVEGIDLMTTSGLDMLIMPGLGFTKDGKRLGRGAGFYDSFLHAYKRTFGKFPFLVGICIREQLTQRIPMELHDICLDRIVYV